MKWLRLILFLLFYSCAGTQTIVPTATHILNCPAISEERAALQNLITFEERYNETKKYFYKKCHHPTTLYKRSCSRWMNYMVLLEIKYLHYQLEYEKASRCTIEEFATLRKVRKK